MKIRKDGITFTLTESDLKKIVKKQMLNESLLSDNAKEAKDNKIQSIIKQLKRLANTLDSVGENMKTSTVNNLLHGVENGIIEKLEDIEDLLHKEAKKVEKSKE
jgi:thiamine kinase-like enzyme